MSYRERGNRRSLAASASAEFEQLEALVRLQTEVRMARPLILDDLAAEGCHPLAMWRAEELLDDYEADLAARIASFRESPVADQLHVLALAQAEMYAASAGFSSE